MYDSIYILYALLIITIIFVICMIYMTFVSNDVISKNIHHYTFFDKSTKKIIFHASNPFYRKLNSVYMSNSIKTLLFSTITDFIKHSNMFKTNNVPRSLRLILSGKEGIGKTTLVEAIASEIDYGIIHFPKNNYSEIMIHAFFNDINNNISSNNIILFDNINFNSINEYNKQLYDLLAELIIKNDKNNIFIFIFTELKVIDFNFLSNYHIHHHYHMDVNINYIMDMINDNIYDDVNKDIKLKNIRQNFLQLNHKITPGYIIPYLLFNEDFQKSLDRFFKIIKN